MIVPGIVAAGIGTYAAIVIPPADATATDLQIVVTHSFVLLAQIFTTVLAIAFTTGMADAAWRTSHGTFEDGLVAFRREGGHVTIAVIVLLGLGLVAALGAPATHGVSGALYAYCCVYTMPSAVVGERPGVIAIGESAAIAFKRPVATIVILVGVTLIAFAVAFGASVLQATPYVGSILGAIVIQAVIAFATLVLVGEYRIARHMEPV